MPRTDELVAAIDRDGYVVVDDVLAPAVVGGLIHALDTAEPGEGVLRRAGSVYGVRDLLRRVPEVRRVADSPAIRALVEPVLGTGAFAVRGLLFDKTPEANWSVPWHRDTTIGVRSRHEVPGFGPWTRKAGVLHVRPPTAVLDQMLTVRIHLDDAGPANGPLNVLPGSHADGQIDDETVRAWRKRVTAVSCPVRRGGVLLLRPLLLHASASAEQPARRRVVHLEYAAEPLPGGLEWLEACA